MYKVQLNFFVSLYFLSVNLVKTYLFYMDWETSSYNLY